jgi:hypothetical protein
MSQADDFNWEAAFRQFAEEARHTVYRPAVMDHPHYQKTRELAARGRTVLEERLSPEERRLLGLVQELANWQECWLQEAAFLAGFATCLKLMGALADPARVIFTPRDPGTLEELEAQLEELEETLEKRPREPNQGE